MLLGTSLRIPVWDLLDLQTIRVLGCTEGWRHSPSHYCGMDTLIDTVGWIHSLVLWDDTLLATEVWDLLIGIYTPWSVLWYPLYGGTLLGIRMYPAMCLPTSAYSSGDTSSLLRSSPLEVPDTGPSIWCTTSASSHILSYVPAMRGGSCGPLSRSPSRVCHLHHVRIQDTRA